MRFALGDSGDQLDDANFTTENADSAVKKLWNFIDFSKKLVEMSEDSFVVREPHSYPEKVFESNIFECIIEALKSYDEMNFKDVLKHAYFNLINARDNYIKAVAILDEKWNKNLIYFCIESIVKLMSPITSHVCEYVWKFVLKHEGTVFDSGLPSVPENFDMTIIQSKTYVTRLLSNMRQVKKMYLKKNKNIEPTICRIYIYNEWPTWKIKTITLLNQLYDPSNKSFPEKAKILELLKEDPELEKNKSNVAPFVNQILNSEDPLAELVVEYPFNEHDVFNILGDYIKKELNITTITILNPNDDNIPDNLQKSNGQPGSPVIFFS